MSNLFFDIKLTIKKIKNDADLWQAFLLIGGDQYLIGNSFANYDDCRINAEKIVSHFSKQKVYLVHDF